MTIRSYVHDPRLLAIAGAVTIALLTGCDGPSAEAAVLDTAAAPATTPVRDTTSLSAEAVRLAALELASAAPVPWRDAWRAPGRLVLDPAATHSLGAVAEGRVARVLVSVGDPVVAGQPLVAIHSYAMTDARGALATAAAADVEAETALALATSAAARAERLLAIRALSLADAERARADRARAAARVAQSRAELARARAMLDHLTGGSAAVDVDAAHEVLVRSPTAGVVVARDAQPGAVVLVGAPLVTVSRATSLLLALRLPEHAVGAAQPGAVVRFGVSALPDARFEARVERVAPTIDSVTRTLEVHARPVGDAGALRAEMYGTAELVGAAGASALVVPSAAVQALEGDTVVVTARARANGLLLEAVRVRVGRRTEEHAEILAGLAAGTPVVTHGAAVAKAEILRRRGEK